MYKDAICMTIITQKSGEGMDIQETKFSNAIEIIL